MTKPPKESPHKARSDRTISLILAKELHRIVDAARGHCAVSGMGVEAKDIASEADFAILDSSELTFRRQALALGFHLLLVGPFALLVGHLISCRKLANATSLRRRIREVRDKPAEERGGGRLAAAPTNESRAAVSGLAEGLEATIELFT